MFKWLLALFGRPKQSDVQLLRQQIESQQRDLVARGLQLNASSTQLQQSKDEIDRLLGLITKHRTKTGQDLCWENDLELWRDAFRDQTIEYPHVTLPDWASFMQGCVLYRASRQCGASDNIATNPSPPKEQRT